MFHHEKDIVEYYSQYRKLYKRFIDDIFAIWCGPKGTLLEFLNALNSKTDRIKLTYCISESRCSYTTTVRRVLLTSLVFIKFSKLSLLNEIINMMTHPLWLAQNLMPDPFVRAQNLVTHPLFAPTHPPLYLLTSPLVI